jgi:hypothetical protein
VLESLLLLLDRELLGLMLVLLLLLLLLGGKVGLLLLMLLKGMMLSRRETGLVMLLLLLLLLRVLTGLEEMLLLVWMLLAEVLPLRLLLHVGRVPVVHVLLLVHDQRQRMCLDTRTVVLGACSVYWMFWRGMGGSGLHEDKEVLADARFQRPCCSHPYPQSTRLGLAVALCFTLILVPCGCHAP